MSSLAAYGIQRFPLAIFAPALLSLVGAAIWSIEDASAAAIVHALLLGPVLVAQFRLWDDMEDADRDRVTHPDRILVSAPACRFRALHASLIVVAGAMCVSRPAALVALVSLETAFWSAYRHLRRHIPDDAWRFGVLLTKYPALLVVVSLATGTVIPSRLAIAATAAYLCACGYEWWHQERTTIGVSR
jgi:hypothetical protein